jgi:uncharacterized protein involved in exopolysaccharide biosynthesis
VESVRDNAVLQEVEEIGKGEIGSTSQLGEPAAPPHWLPYLNLLWERRSTLCKTAVWALMLSMAIAFLIPKRYNSTATLMPPDSAGNNGMLMAALAGKATPALAAMAGDMLNIKSTGAMFVGLLRSRTVEEHIVERFNLQKVYWVRYKQDARRVLDERTEISEDRKSGVITIAVTDGNPQRARDIAQAYVEELNKLVSQVSTSSARRQRMFIEQRIESVKSDLEDAEKQFSSFASKNTALDITEQAKAMVEAGASLQGQLIAAQSELEGLQQIYADSNVRVRAARARIDELKRQLQKIGGTDASVASAAPLPGELYPPIRKLPILGVQWADLYRRVKIQETVYELLNQQYELARIQEAKEIPTVNIIDPANLPETKSFPHRWLIVLLGTALAFMGVITWVVGNTKWREIDHNDPRKVFAREVFSAFSARIPHVLAKRFGSEHRSPKL